MSSTRYVTEKVGNRNLCRSVGPEGEGKGGAIPLSAVCAHRLIAPELWLDAIYCLAKKSRTKWRRILWRNG